jgi:serine protease Do
MGLNATDAQGNALPFMFSYADLVEVIKPSVVTISTQTTMTRWQFGRNQSYTVVGAGTGFIFDATDTMYYIATNAHVIDGATGVTVSIDGSQPLNAIPIGKDIANDLAVIAVPRVAAQRAGIHSVSVAKLGDSDKMRVGDIVLAVGNSLGEGIVVTDGIISALNRRITLESNITLNVLQTNAAINQGNSGGPLVNLIGEVIGVNTAKASQNVTDGTRASIEGTGYAIPSNIVKDVIVRIMNGEMSESIATATPRLGISGGTLSDELMEKLAEELGIEIRGVYVSGVTEGESADLAGVLPDDIITAINGRQIADFEGLRDIILQNKPGDTVTLIIWRNGTMLTLNAVLGSSF